MRIVEVGSIVRFQEESNRLEEGQNDMLPAVVMNQWPDGSLQLFCFGFAQQYLRQSIPLDRVEVVLDPVQLRIVMARTETSEGRLKSALVSSSSTR